MKQNLSPLIKWLTDNKRSQSWLAEELGIHRVNITTWFKKKYIPSKHLGKIEEIINPQTKGEK